MLNATAFIGRFQPLHTGHMAVLEQAFKQSDTVIVAVGSARSPRTPRNPFTFFERSHMITESVRDLSLEYASRLKIVPIDDMLYNDEQWIKHVHNQILDVTDIDAQVALIGHAKDHSSYYLNMFPNWPSIPVANYLGLDATIIRNAYFSNIGAQWVKNCDGHKDGDSQGDKQVTPAVKRFLERFLDSTEYKYLIDEFNYVTQYKKDSRFVGLPYNPTFVTVDACVVQSGYVLLIKRKVPPGKDLWALPGGFLNTDEQVIDATIRELREETRLRVPAPVLRGSIVATKVFDDPYRSLRGRTITNASLFHLKREDRLPSVRGDDDAKEAKWWPLAELNPELMFEDHYSIITHFAGMI